MDNIKITNGIIKPGDWVIAAGNNDYAYLIGQVTAIHAHGSPEQVTDNKTDDIYVDFSAAAYPPERIAEIEEHFSSLYGGEKAYGEIALDAVAMSPQMLIDISHIGEYQRDYMASSRDSCETFCSHFPALGTVD